MKRPAWWTRLENWRFLQLAICLAVLMTVLPWTTKHVIVQIIVQLFLLNSLLVTISSEGRTKHLRVALWTLWGLAVAAGLLTWTTLPFDFRSAELLLLAALLVLCVVGILRFVFRSRRLTVDSIFGAVVAYLLLATFFAICDTLLFKWDPTSFHFPEGPPSSIGPLHADLLYFSLVTIVTLGYGDVFPVTPAARMISAFEGVVGQFYVAAVVAMLVGRFIAQAMEEGSGDSS